MPAIREALITAAWPEADQASDPEAVEQFEVLREIVTAIRNARAEKNVPASSRLAATFAAGAIDAAAIAPNAIGASELAADAVTEIQAGLSTLDAAGVRSAVGLAAANLDTQLAAVQADTDNIQTRLPAALVGGRMDSSIGAIVSGVIAAASFAAGAFDAVWTVAARILTAATNITSTGGTTVPQTGDSFARLGAPAGASVSADIAEVPTANANADGYLDRAAAVDSYTPRQVQRLQLAALAGKSSGGTASGASAPIFRAADDSKARIIATCDASGNRSAVSLDAT